MSANPVEKQGKIRRLGQLLQWATWIGGIFYTATFALLAWFAPFVVRLFRDASREDLAGFLTSFWVGNRYVEVGDVSALLSQDQAFFEDHLPWFRIQAVIIILVIWVSFFFVIRLARCWIRGDVFGDRPIKALRWAGGISLGHAIIGLIYSFVAPYSPLTLLTFGSWFNDLIIFSMSTSPVGGFVFGFLALTMSWVLEYGRHLRDEQALVV